jgi:hypothetical protein
MMLQMFENHFFELLISISKLCPSLPSLIDLVLKSGLLDPILFQILRNIINYVPENQLELIVPFIQQRLQSKLMYIALNAFVLSPYKNFPISNQLYLICFPTTLIFLLSTNKYLD